MFALRASPIARFGARSFSSTPRAAYSFSRMQILGRLPQDVEIVTTNSGMEIAKYSVAVNERQKNGEEITSYFRVAKFDPSEHIKGLKKGTVVFVEADAQMRKYDDKDGIQRTALDLIQRRLTTIRRPTTEGGEEQHVE